MNRLHHWLCSSGHWRRTLEQRLPAILSGAKLGNDVLEIGPGPGLTTEFLRTRVTRLTTIEADPALAASLRRQMRGANVDVITGDAAAMPFPDAAFSGCATFTMLHHVPSPQMQDTVLREIGRVLRPGGELVGTDTLPSTLMRLIHLGDTFAPVDPDTLPRRLREAGLEVIRVQRQAGYFRFHARRPERTTV
ncbi:MAG TPA: class I SAM-dependent methyltransferase [Terriglobales bacterium]|nr:class I SAM-dependent methyltransferase [Terriglobales bacterium]